MSASGPHILVTGSTRAIGAAVALVLASRGVRVVGDGRTAAVAFLALDAPASMTGAVLDINGASYVR
jgi:NAD(P)-dependent dehydrogenase (short-subunit alcohol dehydrogenase family)